MEVNSHNDLAKHVCEPYCNHTAQGPWKLLQKNFATDDGLADVLVIVIASTLPLDVNDGSCGKENARLGAKGHHNIWL